MWVHLRGLGIQWLAHETGSGSVYLVADHPRPQWWPSFNQVGITECSLYNVREEIQRLRDLWREHLHP